MIEVEKMKEKNMENKLQLLSKEMDDLLMAAYNMGVEDTKRDFESGGRMDAKMVIKQFINYIQKYRIVTTDNGIGFATEEHLYSSDHVINMFKLAYGYED